MDVRPSTAQRNSDESALHQRAENQAKERNLKRLKWAEKTDSDMISKYLPSNAYDVLPWVPVGPDDHFIPPNSFMNQIALIASTPVPPPTKPPFHFELSLDAAIANSNLLKEQGSSLCCLLDQHQNSTLGYCSEFRPLWQLDSILHHHPNYPPFRCVLTGGMRFRGEPLPSSHDLRLDLEAAITRGNHKSALENIAAVRELLAKDVAHGFAVPLTLDTIRHLPNAQVQPIGMVKQWSLDVNGDRKQKLRLTHDASFIPRPGSTSVNQRIDLGQYDEMIYGWCLPRLIHYIVSMRKNYPCQRILIAKFDYSDAYRRIPYSAEAAKQQILIVDNIAFLMLRMTFGGSANPPTWCSFSEMVTDLANEIVLAENWDTTQVFSPLRSTPPQAKVLDNDIPFGAAEDMVFDIPLRGTIRTDGFIDDLINVILDTEENRVKGSLTVPLSVHVTSRPHAGSDEPLPRRNLLGDEKLLAEGTHTEIQVILGWTVNCRSLTILLPTDKFIPWDDDLKQAIEAKSTTFQQLETTVGRLNHASLVVPLSGHFLNRLRQRVMRQKYRKQQISLRQDEIDDMKLWRVFLKRAQKGLSMNLLVHRRPTVIACSDSCPMGIGGFLLDGFAWRVRIPTCSYIYNCNHSNNALEFLGMAINIWLAIKRGQRLDCILAIGDNTSAIGWLFHSSKLAPKSMYFETVQLISRKIASLVIDAEVCLAGQHLQGTRNDVADLLSYYGNMRGKPHPLAPDNPDNETLTMRFHQFCHQLIPRSFEINQLPNDVLSWTVQVLQTFESSLIRNSKHHTNPMTDTGDVGSIFLNQSGYLHPASLSFPSKRPKSSPALFWRPTDQLNLTRQEEWLASVRSAWYRRLSELPQAAWLRRYGTICNKAPFTSREAPSFSLQSAPF